MIPYIYDDGNAWKEGFSPIGHDCVARAIAIAERISFKSAIGIVEKWKALNPRLRRRNGIHPKLTRKILGSLGYRWTPLMGIGTGCQVHLRRDELPAETVIVKLSHHVAAVVHGVLHDTGDSSRGGTRCVYGYWAKP